MAQLIPKTIWTAWLSESGDMPPLIAKCIESQKIEGYEHRLITLDDIIVAHPYVAAAIAAKKWVKAVDFLRMQTLYEHGGIFLDADVEILPGKKFDELLDLEMFAAKENNGFIGVAVMGARPGHPFVKQWMEWVLERFRGDDDLNFESSMEPVVHGYYEWGWDTSGFALLPTNILYPFDHQQDTVHIEPETITYHHFYKSWKMPTVTFIIPTLDRPEGLQKCLDSITGLNYPQELIEYIVLPGKETVPEKVDQAYLVSKSEYIVYAADDTEFTPDSLRNAVLLAQKGYDLVAFNTQGEKGILPDEGNICEHFLIKRDFVPKIGGEIFCTRMRHVGVDNLLWAKARRQNKAAWCKEAVVLHKHWSQGGQWDATYAKGWDTKSVEEDRKILAEELAKL
ncbi:MAG: capsular polysaccharide synthesis protein [Patescibacteria group bacterium]